MRTRHKYRSSGRRITQITFDWLQNIGLEIHFHSNGKVYFIWCGMAAATVEETDYRACKLTLEEWVVRELIECHRITQIGEISIIRDRDGLRDLAHKLIKVFDHRTKDLRYKFNKFHDIHDELITILNIRINSKKINSEDKGRLKYCKEEYESTHEKIYEHLSGLYFDEYQKLPPLKGYLPD